MAEKLGKGGEGQQEYDESTGKYGSSESKDIQASMPAPNQARLSALKAKIAAKKSPSFLPVFSNKQIHEMSDSELDEEEAKCEQALTGGYLRSLNVDVPALKRTIPDKKLRVANMRALVELQRDFPLLSAQGNQVGIPFAVKRASGGVLGWNETDHTKATTFLGLNSEFYGAGKTFDVFTRGSKNSYLRGWCNECAGPTEYAQSTLKHEYGHAIFNTYRSQHPELMLSNMDIALGVQEVARRTNPDYDYRKDATGYVKSYPYQQGQLNGSYNSEWLAETFASMLSGKPNEGAKALKIWLAENIYKGGK